MQSVRGRQFIAVPVFALMIAVISTTAAYLLPTVEAAEAEQVLLEVNRSTRLARLAREQKQLNEKPDLAATLTQAGQLREHYRQSHDPRFLGFADALLAPFLDETPVSLDVLVLQADIDQAAHNFDVARQRLNQAAALAPTDPQVWMMLAAIELSTGHYARARSACARLLTLTRPLLTTGCAAQVSGVTGKATTAYRVLQETLHRESGESPAIKAWAQSLLADLAWRLDDKPAADKHYASAFSLDPDNITLQNEYALFLVLTGQHDKALTLAQSIPQLLLPYTMALRQGNLMRELSLAATTQREIFAAAQRRGESGHAREQALFELFVEDNPDRALELSLENWTTQREPVDLWLLASSARAAQSASVLAIVQDWQDKTGFEDARLQGVLETGS